MSLPIERHPAYLNAVAASVWERAVVETAHPELEEFISDATSTGSRNRPPASWGLVIDTYRLAGLLNLHWQEQRIDPIDVADTALVLVLPPTFNWAVRKMVVQTPESLNSPQLDLRNNSSFLGWQARLPGDTCDSVILVPDDYTVGGAIGSAYRVVTHEWGWMPVVMVAGDTVALGGFVVDEGLVCGMQAANMSAQSHLPEDAYSEEQLNAARRQSGRYGLKPWLFERWPTEYGWTLEPELVYYD